MLDLFSDRFSLQDTAPKTESFRDALAAGLAAPQKAIPCHFLYDRRGSLLFDEICTLEEYYLTRTELKILRQHAPDIADLAGPGAHLIELGAGSSEKARILLDAFESPAGYTPIDVSREHLREAAASVARDDPELRVAALCADYNGPLTLPDVGAQRRVGFFPGSTIGNLSPEEAEALLARWRKLLGAGALMIVGVDLKKDVGVLEAAYDDPGGVTEAFIKNVLARANRDLGADFDLDRFAYEARWRDDPGRIEMNLRSLGAQSVRIGKRRFAFADGERVHVENSHKYSLNAFAALARAAAFMPIAAWCDQDRKFSVHGLEAGL
jgi:dimethylhistidine N-methyltransferase